MKVIPLVAAVLPILAFASFAEEPPNIEICTFKDGKKAAVTLAFDDASKDHLTSAVPLLEKYGFKGTFYVT